MENKKVQRKNLLSRIIYDFGNSFFYMVVGSLVLVQRLVLDNHLPDIRYGAWFAIITLFALVTGPLLGTRSDKIGKRLPFVRGATIGLLFFNALMVITALSNIVSPQKALIVMAFALIAQFFYQTSLVFYNALLDDVSTEDTRGKIAWLGEWSGSLWRVASAIILLPFANGAIALFGSPWRQQAFLPAFILTVIFMLPIVFKFKEPQKKIIHTTQNVYKKTWVGLKKLWTTHKNVGIYLLAFSLISDVMVTVVLYFAIVADAIYMASDNLKFLGLGILTICAATGGMLIWKLGDTYGHKKILIFCCIDLAIVVGAFFLMHSIWVLFVIAVAWWLGVGWYYGLTKALMIKISPADELGEYFGLFSTFQKFSSITAPLIRGWITLWLAAYPVLKYRVAWLVLVGILIIWTILMTRVKAR